MALKLGSCILFGRRAVRKNPYIRTVVRKFPYSDRLFELSVLATILTCYDKKKLQEFFSNKILKLLRRIGVMSKTCILNV